jgi:protein-tyrosine phosphatase
MPDKADHRGRLLRNLSVLILIVIIGLLLWVYYPGFTTPGVPLTFKFEGALDSKLNFRDAGASINQCAGRKLMDEGKIFRSSGFFSGWSCDRVGNPDVIYSLNYSDQANHRYYCRGISDNPYGFNVGVFFQHDEISDIEFLLSWDQKPEQVKSVCQFLQAGMTDLKAGKKILYHCEAGRDRTGAVVALLAAYELEQNGDLSDAAIDAIECDYRKSKSLSPEKYGRMANFLRELRTQGGVRGFLKTRCGPLF